jgi:hypothetical protein
MALALGSSASSLRVGSGTPSRMYRGSTAFWDADAAAYIRAVEAADGQALELGVCNAYHNFFLELKATSGLFSAIKASCILCGARTLAGALVPVVGDAPTNLPVANGFTSGDYSRTAGLTGDGTSYLDSGRADNDDDSQDNNHIAVFVNATPTGTTQDFAGTHSTGAGSAERLLRRNADTNRSEYLNNDKSTGGTTGVPAAGTLFASSRISPSGYTVRLNGANIPRISASTGVNALNAFIFCRNFIGSPLTFSTDTLAFYSLGLGLGELGLAALDTAVRNLITAIGEAL